MPTTTPPPKLPPSWFKHAFWRVHRALHRFSRGRFLWSPASKRGWGAMGLTITGRKTGKERRVIIGYIQDGPNLVALAMNGWDQGHPAWWLNLQAHPDVVVRLPHQPPCQMHGRLAVGEERDRLWQRWAQIDLGLDSYASRRSVETPVVVFEPRDATAEDPRHHVEMTGRGAPESRVGAAGAGIGTAQNAQPASAFGPSSARPSSRNGATHPGSAA